MRMPEDSQDRRVPFCENCFLYYDSYCVDEDDLIFQDGAAADEPEPENPECEDDPCIVQWTLRSNPDECDENPM
jgi:hypothetical protein